MANEDEVTIYKGLMLSDDPQRSAVEGVIVQIKDSRNPEKRYGLRRSLRSGLVEVTTSNPRDIEILRKMERNEIDGGIDIFFCVSPGAREALRPRLINQRSLYCEGREPVISRSGVDRQPERRIIRPALTVNLSKENRDPSFQRGVVAYTDNKSRAVLIVGEPGAGKTTFLAEIANSMSLESAEFDLIFCYSFETDPRCRAFVDVLSLSSDAGTFSEDTLSTHAPAKLGDVLNRMRPSLFLIDGIDEMSTSWRDHVWKTEVERAICGIIEGKGDLGKHSIVMSSRYRPKFLKKRKDSFLQISLKGCGAL